MEHIGCPIVGDKLYGANKIKDAKIKNHPPQKKIVIAYQNIVFLIKIGNSMELIFGNNHRSFWFFCYQKHTKKLV